MNATDDAMSAGPYKWNVKHMRSTAPVPLECTTAGRIAI